MRTSGPSQQRSLLLPPPRNGTGITGCRQCADLQRKFCKFFQSWQVLQVLQVSCAPSAVLALECKDSSVVSKVFEMRRRFFPKSLRTFDKIWVLPKKRKSRMGVKIVGNHTGFCGGPRGGRWITAEGFGRRRFLAKVLVGLRIFPRTRPNLIICNHSFLTLHYSTKIHNLRFSHATSSSASPIEL